MTGDMELMKELRRLKTGKGELDELPDTVDGVTGERHVAEQFTKVYSNLYSSAGSVEGMAELQDKTRQLLQAEDSRSEVEKVTAEVVKKAVLKMKMHKMNISQGFSSCMPRTTCSSCSPSPSRTGWLVLAYSYQEQLAWVRWGRACTSGSFGIENGTRQGSVASPAFWSVYLDPLFARLREAGFGCHIGGVYVGVVGYADDLLLLAPTRDAAQKMLEICEDFTDKNNIQFSTNVDPGKSKSKALYVLGPRGGALPRPAPLVLCGRPLPWVDRADHLGHALHQDGLMRQDCREKRAQFIDSSVKLREAFYFAYPHEEILATEKYCTSFYGSNLRDLASPEAEMVFAAWRTGHKLAWGVHRGCRSYLVQQVLAPHVTSLRVQTLCKFRGFFRSLLASPSNEVAVVARLAARDLRSSVGANLALIRRETGLDPWAVGPGNLRAALLAADRVEVPEGDEWRVPYLWRLLAERLQAHYAADTVTEKGLQVLIDSLVVN